jgi:hypothetical protein
MAILQNTNINSTGYLGVASGTTAQRPGTPSYGMTRYNTTTSIMEWYNGTSWLDSSKNIVQDGLVLWLDAGNTNSYSGSGSTWYDLSGNGNHMTITGTPTYSTSNGGYLRFNSGASSLTSYASIPNANCSANFKSMPSGYTSFLGFQSYQPSTSWQPIFTFGDGANFVDTWQQASTRYYGLDINNTSPSPFVPLDLYTGGFNIWTSYVSVANGFAHYKNGVSQLTGTVSSWTSSSTTDFCIARRPEDTGYYMDGVYAFLYIYNRVLSATEITQTYNAIKARYGL